jgi:hypothetical protein
MTAAALTPSVEYIENGVTLAYAVSFRFKAPTHIKAQRIAADGTLTELAYGSDYSVTGGETDSGGTLSVVAAGAAGTRLRIRRVTPRAQDMDYTTADTFPAESHEGAVDKAMLIDQEQDQQIDDIATRALLVPDGETAPVISPKAQRAGKFPLWDATGDDLLDSEGTGADLGLRGDLANSLLGTLLVVWKAAGVGAVARTLWAKLNDLPLHASDFGVVPDNNTIDNTLSVQRCFNALPKGGEIILPAGKIRFAGKVVVPSNGSYRVTGAGGVDFIHGSPVPAATGTYLWQATDGETIFDISAGASYFTYRDMSFGPAETPSDTPDTTGKTGIRISGTIPNVIWSPNFERLLFFNLEFGILAQDPNGGTHPLGQDYSIAPASVRQCFFIGTLNGVYLDTNNADMWTYEQSFFFTPSGGNGVYLRRFGLQHFINCSSGGTAIDSNRFVNIEGAGANSVDKVLFTNTQCETLTQFVNVQPSAGGGATFDIVMNNCVAELGAHVYLASNVNFTSINTRYSSANIYIDDPDAKITTINDTFAAADFYFLAGAPDTSFINTIWGYSPSAIYSNRVYQNGLLVQMSGTATGVANLTPTTLFSLSNAQALYEVFAYIPEAAAGTTYMNSSRLGGDGGTLARIGGEAGAGMTVTVSGTNVRAEQNSGTSQTINWRWRRIA